MRKKLKEIENDGKPRSVIYLRFSYHVIERTETYSAGEVNVDVDPYNEVAGIEMLSMGSPQLKALSEIVARYDLDVSPLLMACRS